MVNLVIMYDNLSFNLRVSSRYDEPLVAVPVPDVPWRASTCDTHQRPIEPHPPCSICAKYKLLLIEFFRPEVALTVGRNVGEPP